MIFTTILLIGIFDFSQSTCIQQQSTDTTTIINELELGEKLLDGVLKLINLNYYNTHFLN